MRRRVSPSPASGAAPICVLLCDDHEIPRAAIAGMLALEPDIEVVGEAANGAETVDLARVLRPDVTIMDLKIPVMDGFDAMRRIRNENPGTRVPVLIGAGTDTDLVGAIEEGAPGGRPVTLTRPHTQRRACPRDPDRSRLGALRLSRGGVGALLS